jgi:hypothetical protein
MSKIKKDDVQISTEANAAKNALKDDLKPVGANKKQTNIKNNSGQASQENVSPKNIFTKIGFTSSHLKYGLVLVAVLLIGLLGGFVISNGQSDNTTNQQNEISSSASMNIMPSVSNISNNQVFTVSIKGNSGETNVNAVQATIAYPKDLVEVASIDTTNSAYKLDVISTNSDGKISIARGQIGGLTGDNLIANITFKSVKSGKANLKFIEETALLSSKTNKNIISIPSNVNEATIIIN